MNMQNTLDTVSIRNQKGEAYEPCFYIGDAAVWNRGFMNNKKYYTDVVRGDQFVEICSWNYTEQELEVIMITSIEFDTYFITAKQRRDNIIDSILNTDQ